MEERLAVLQHELRSPVAALVAIAEALAGEGRPLDPADRRRLLELAIAAGRSIDRLLADEDVFSVVPEPIDLARFLDDVGSGRADLRVEPGLVLVADPVRLRQAIANLLDNAARHASSITVAARARGSAVAISVSDDGPGLPGGVDVFAIGVSGADSTGYGLAIVRSIVERHGGWVELSSVPGEGTTVTLVLPSGVD